MVQVTHWNPPMSVKLLASLKVSTAFTDWKPRGFGQLLQAHLLVGSRSTPSTQLPPKRLLKLCGSTTCHLSDLFFPRSGDEPVSPSPTLTTKNLKYSGSHRTRLPPSYWDTTRHLTHRIQPFEHERRCKCPCKDMCDSAACPELFKPVFISDRGFTEAHRSPLPYSSWRKTHSSGLQATAKP